VREHAVARPSEERKRLKATLVPHFQSPDLARLREEAEAIYREFVGGS
jgi:hypothetical protein